MCCVIISGRYVCVVSERHRTWLVHVGGCGCCWRFIITVWVCSFESSCALFTVFSFQQGIQGYGSSGWLSVLTWCCIVCLLSTWIGPSCLLGLLFFPQRWIPRVLYSSSVTLAFRSEWWAFICVIQTRSSPIASTVISCIIWCSYRSSWRMSRSPCKSLPIASISIVPIIALTNRL